MHNKNIQNNFINSFFLLFLALFITLTPSTFLLAIPNLHEYDSKRTIEFFLIYLCLLIGLFNSSLRTDIIQQFILVSLKIRLVLIILFLIILTSSFFAQVSTQALLESALYSGLLLLAFFLANISKQQKYFQALFFIIISISALCYQTNFFTAFLASFIENIPLQWPEPFSGFSNVRFFNQYQIWSITLIALPLLIYPKLDKRLLNSLKAIAIGWTILLFASASRGAVGSVILAMIITLFIFRKHAKLFLKLNSLILLTGFIGYLLLFKLLPTLLESQVAVGWIPIESIATSSGRAELWQYAIQYIMDNPWLGIGPMHYAYYPGPTHAHPHNSLLQWASEMGIPSALLVISLVYSGLAAWVKKFYRLSNENKLYAPSHLWIGLFCSLCSGLIYSLVSGVIVMPLSQIMMTLIAGWMLGIYFQDQPAKPVSQKQHIAFMLLAGATLITLTYTILPSLLPRLISYQDLPYQDYPTLAPRFWQIGGIPH